MALSVCWCCFKTECNVSSDSSIGGSTSKMCVDSSHFSVLVAIADSVINGCIEQVALAEVRYPVVFNRMGLVGWVSVV